MTCVSFVSCSCKLTSGHTSLPLPPICFLMDKNLEKTSNSIYDFLDKIAVLLFLRALPQEKKDMTYLAKVQGKRPKISKAGLRWWGEKEAGLLWEQC